MLLMLLMAVGGLSPAWAAGYTRTLSETYQIAGYKLKAFYDFQNNSPEVLPTSGDFRYREYGSGGYWGMHNYGSGTRSGTATIAVAESDILVLQIYNSSYVPTINKGTQNATLTAANNPYYVYDITTTADDITFTVPRYGGIVAALVMEVDEQATTADYTINYLLNGEGDPVKTVKETVAIGSTVITDASFFANDVKYFRANGQPESFVIAAGDNIFNVNVRLAEIYDYTLLNNLGETITTGSGFEGETVTVGYPRYLLADGKFYEAGKSNNEYRTKIALNEDNTSATVTYTLKEGVNAVFYAEGEKTEGMTVSTAGNIPARASGAEAGVAKEDVTITTLPVGKYIFHAGIFTSKSSYGENTVNFGIGEQTFSAAFTNVNLCEVASNEYTLNAETAIKFLTSSWADAQLDYLWIEKTGDYEEADPNVGEHYIYSAADGKFLSRGADWGTRAIADNYGVPANVVKNGEVYNIQFLDNELYLGSDGYADKASDYDNVAWTIEETDGGFKLKNGNGSYAKITDGNVNIDGTAETATVWSFKTIDEQKAIVATTQQANIVSVATAYGWDDVTTTDAFTAKVGEELVAQDQTALIKSATAGNKTDWVFAGTRNETYNIGDYGAELFNTTGTISQTITVPEAGIYKLTLNALFRQGGRDNMKVQGAKGYVLSNAYVTVNDTYFAQVPDWYSDSDGDSPDNTGQAKAAFEAGKYAMTVWAYVGNEKQLTITLHQPNWINYASWMLFNNFALTYYAVPAGVAVESVSLDKTSATIALGDAPLTLTATVQPDNADDKNIIWTSSDETVATVANGVVTALNAGTATITATSHADDTKKASCEVTVTQAAAPSFYSEIAAGDFYIMNAATGKFLGGANSWGTQASLIEHGIPFTSATVSEGVYTLDSHTYNNDKDHFLSGTYVDGAATNLYITSLGSGKYSISTADGSAFISAKGGTTVVDNTAANANSSLAQWYFISKNDRDKMLAAAKDENPVDATYYIKEANISRNLAANGQNNHAWSNLSTGGDQDNSNFVAQVWNASVNVEQTIKDIPNGTYTLTMQGFTSGTDVKLYANETEVVVRTNDSGANKCSAAAALFAAKSYPNTLTVTVTDRTLKIGLKGDCTSEKWLCYDNFELYLTSYTPVTAINATIDNAEFEKGKTATITAATDPATASFNALSYSSSDETVATVDANGVVTGVAEGNATITVKAEMENVTKTFDVTIVKPAVVPTEITLNETEIALNTTTTTFTLTAVVGPEGANQAVTFASSDETVATVNAEGVVTAVLPGTATITVTSAAKAEITAEATVTVTFPETEVPALTYTNDGATRTVSQLGANLIKNGAFEYPNNFYGWTTGSGAAMSADNFNLITEDDNHYIKAKGHTGVGGANSIGTGWAIEAGKTYVFGYKVKSTSAGNSEFHVVSLTNTLGTETMKVSKTETAVGTDWTDVAYTFTNPATDGYAYVQFRARWLNSAVSFDDFYLCEAVSTTEGNVDYATAAIPTANIGTGAFQYSQDAIDAANNLVQGTATVEDVQNAYDALTTINEPSNGQLFNVILTYSGWTYDQKAMTYLANGRNDAGNYNIQYKEAANKNLAQAFTFTKVSGNNYTMSQIDADGNVRYISTGVPYGGNTSQIRTTTDASKALVVTVIPTATEGKWNLRNTEAKQFIGSQDAGVYTVNSHIDFNIVETTKPSIEINTTAAGWGTVMLPFAQELPADVKAYTCEATEGDRLTLTEVDKLEANKPYIVEGSWNANVTGDAQGTALNYTEGLFTGVYADTEAPEGSYVLQNKKEKLGFYRVAKDKQPTVGSNHAYLTVPASVRDAFFFGDGETTAISTLKALSEGTVEIYSLNGVKQSKLQKGTNILKMSDGSIRKVMVK